MKQDTMEDTIVQDYRSYTAEEILRGILAFSESRGWTDPANLGGWLGAIQRWKDGDETQNQIRRVTAERDILLSAIAPADYAKVQARLVAISESPDEPLSPTPEIRYQLRNWHHVSCHSIAGAECTCLDRREALITELAGQRMR